MSRVHPQHHEQPTNTTTMVMEPLAPPAAWIEFDESTPSEWRAALLMYVLRPLSKGFVKINKLQ
jgi:hypothetical protein